MTFPLRKTEAERRIERLFDLPAVKQIVADHERQAEEAALAQRLAALAALAPAEEAAALASAEHQQAQAQLAAALQSVELARLAESRTKLALTRAHQQLRDAQRQLHRHGGAIVTQARAALLAHQRDLVERLPAVEARIERMQATDATGWFARKVRDDKAAAQAETMRSQLARIDTALTELSALERAPLSPQAIEAKARQITEAAVPWPDDQEAKFDAAGNLIERKPAPQPAA